MSEANQTVPPQLKDKSPRTYSVGTLKYTLGQLWVVFCWMLWGSVAMTMINSVFRSATPFLFRNHNLSDTFTVVLMGSVFSLMNVCMNPVLSFNSDRCRSRWGRRIPFILYTAIPLGLAMAAMPFYPYLAGLLPQGGLFNVSYLEVMFFVGGIFYCFFWLFIGAIYFYLIPDVIPVELMGRYYSFFRVSGIIAGVFFSKYVFKYSVSHPEIVYPATAVFYVVSIVAMCLIVKEGQYPEVEKSSEVKPWYERLVNAVKTYATECFTKKYYWSYYCVGLAYGLSGCVGVFMNFFYTDACNMSVEQAGELGVYIGIGSFISCLLAGFVVDKCGAFQSAITSLFFMALLYFLGGIFIHDFTSAICWRLPFCLPSGIYAVAGGKMLVEIFPRSRFGQFASAQAMFISLVVALVNYPVGLLSDFVKSAGADTSCVIANLDIMPLMRSYRFVNYWCAASYLLGMVLLLFFYVVYQKNRRDKASEL